MHAGAQHRGDQLLHFRRVLRGGPDLKGAILAGRDQRDLGFQIKVLLPADMKLSLNTVRRTRQCRLDVAALVDMRLWTK